MKEPKKIGYLIQEPDGIRFIEDDNGSLRIYQSPGENCWIGADVAEGFEWGDQHAAIVLGMNNNTMATFNTNKIDPDEYTRVLNMLGRYYHMPMIGVEYNSVGIHVNIEIAKIYPAKKIHWHMRMDEKRIHKTKKYGWWTNSNTKHLMLGYLKEEIREGSTRLYDKQLIQQCMRFVNDDGKLHAQEGELDDMVMARAIAGMMRRLHPIVNQRVYDPNSIGRPR